MTDVASPLRELRERSGLTQAELATRAGVSRQMIGAIESGRHLPRVDAAISLAQALETHVDELFGRRTPPSDAISGRVPSDGALVRVGWVGDRAITTPVHLGTDDWGVADGVVRGGRLSMFDHRPSGLVVAGCEPGLGMLERLLREAGSGAVAASASTAAARVALSSGRLHAAVVHGPPDDRFPVADVPVVRIRLASWRVGLAAPDPVDGDWWRAALSGAIPVVQREDGAGVQRAFLDAIGGRRPPGPIVSTHLESARTAASSGMPSVTIEPAALALGLAFHELEIHEAELWVAVEWAGSSFTDQAVATMLDRRFRARLEAVGGYDLTDLGTRVA